MTGKELARLAVALLLGAALAFPAGRWLADEQERIAAPRFVPPASTAKRDMFSPSIRNDPYFVGKQREGVEALETHCRRTGEMCAEARAARRRIEELAND